MIVETLILGASAVGAMGCWAMVQKHRITSELQKHKIDADYKIMNPPPEPAPYVAPAPRLDPSPAQQSLTALLARRESLEQNINTMRERVANYTDKSYAQYRTDALEAIEDARKEQQELVLEQTGLLEMMQGMNNGITNSAAQSVQPLAGRRVAQRVDDLDDVRDAELHDEETGRESTA